MNPHLGFASGVQILLPKTDALVVCRHAQTASSFAMRTVPPFTENPAENWFFVAMDAILIRPKELRASERCGVNPVRLCAEIR